MNMTASVNASNVTRLPSIASAANKANPAKPDGGKAKPGKPAQNDPAAAKLADATRKALKVWGRADGLSESCLLDVFRAVAHGGTTTPEMVAKAAPHLTEGSSKAYSAMFNKAAKVAALIGLDRALALIESAAKMDGRKHERVVGLFADVMEHGKAAKPATDADKAAMVKGAQARMVERDAARVKAKADAKAEAKDGKRAPQAPVAVKAVPYQQAAKSGTTTLAALIADAASWEVPDSRAALRQKAVAALQAAHEAVAALTK